MEYAKDEIFQITYNKKLDKLQIGQPNIGKRILKKIKHHKIITLSIIAIIAFSIANTIMIYNFIQLLLKI